ncbi:MAG: histidine--tRNA ligase [Nitrospirae bacterium]|nr:histidine--tRNA ligase [Nitrospirota bacterium]
MSQIRGIKGVKDVLPDESAAWQYLQQKARDIFHTFGYSEIIIPIIEFTELFARSIGETTDIVEKEMYTFDDRDGRKITLRPEGTASVVRSYIEHNLRDSAPFSKLYYIGPMFRRERPQAGRFRQFYQIGAEVFGIGHYRIEAEVLHMQTLLFGSLNITGVELQVNSIGCPQCRPAFREALRTFFLDKKSELCENCQRRFDVNPLRILDCKSSHCHALAEKAPKTVDHLCSDCLSHFNGVQESLKAAGVAFINNPRLVRGLDYYTRTAFEFVGGALGAQNAVAAGGRYDNLVEELGGPPTPAVGFSIGVERLFSLFDNSSVTKNFPIVFIAALGDAAQKEAFSIINLLHKEGISAVMDYNGGSLKSQMRRADKLKSARVIIIGEDELSKGSVILRDMQDNKQEEVPVTEIISRLKT